MMAAIGTGATSPAAYDESGHLRHRLRLQRCTRDRPQRRDRGILLIHRWLDAADVHNELHRDHRVAARPLQCRYRSHGIGHCLCTRGANGVTVVPFFGGERTPNLPNGRGSIMGLTNTNLNQNNLLKAGAEGASFALRYGVDRLQELGIKASEITLTGGGSNSASWRQIIADICNVPTRVCNNAEGAAFGAALQALQLLAPDSSIADIANNHVAFDDAKEAFPDIDNVARYQDYYQRYQDYVSALRPLYKT